MARTIGKRHHTEADRRKREMSEVFAPRQPWRQLFAIMQAIDDTEMVAESVAQTTHFRLALNLQTGTVLGQPALASYERCSFFHDVPAES